MLSNIDYFDTSITHESLSKIIRVFYTYGASTVREC
jgi:hypothetical protein